MSSCNYLSIKRGVGRKEIGIGEEMHNVFPGNTFSSNDLPFLEDEKEEKVEVVSNRVTQMSLSPSFKAKIVPFNRARDALKSVEKDFLTLEAAERLQLKQVLEDLEQTLTQLKAETSTNNSISLII